jgi:hypothetical protein
MTPPGRLVSCPSAEEIKQLDGVEDAHVHARPGSHVSGRPSSERDRVAEALVVADSRSGLLERQQQLEAWFSGRSHVE